MESGSLVCTKGDTNSKRISAAYMPIAKANTRDLVSEIAVEIGSI